MADFSSGTMPGGRQWSNIFKYWKEKRTVILEFFAWWKYLSKLKEKYFFTYTMNEWMNEWMNEFITSRPELEGNVKGSPSSIKEVIPARNMDLHKRIKSANNVNYILTKHTDF